MKKGNTDEAVKSSASRFRDALEEKNGRLNKNQYLMGKTLNIIDVAWSIHANRLILCDYPMVRLLLNVNLWFLKLLKRPKFARAAIVRPKIQRAVEVNHNKQQKSGITLGDIANL